MITVEYDSEANDVGLVFDRHGAEFLMEMIQELLDKGSRDHLHLTSGPSEIFGKRQLPEFSALSLEKISPNTERKVADLLTLAYRPALQDK